MSAGNNSVKRVTDCSALANAISFQLQTEQLHIKLVELQTSLTYLRNFVQGKITIDILE